MMISPFPLMDVISQIKEYTFSASMENQAVRLGYLSKTQNNAKQKLQNNQLIALHLLWLNKKKERPFCLILTSDIGLLLFSYHVCLGLWSYCWFFTSREKERTGQTDRVTMPLHDFKFNDDSIAYHMDEHRSVKHREIKLRFVSEHYNVVILMRSENKSYALTSNEESIGNTNTNSTRKKMCTILNKKVCKFSSDMVSLCIYPCAAASKIRTVNTCISLTVKELLDTVLSLYKVKESLRSIWVEAYPFPTKNLWNQVFQFRFYMHLVITFKIVYYNDWLLQNFYNKLKECKSHP